MNADMLTFAAALSLVVLWFAITVSGLVYNLLNLDDAYRVFRWQEAIGVNGARRLLATGHVRTMALRSVELGWALAIAIVQVFHVSIGNWFNVAGAFAIVGGISAASWFDRRDRHKLTEEKG